jgi:hypothetical protein
MSRLMHVAENVKTENMPVDEIAKVTGLAVGDVVGEFQEQERLQLETEIAELTKEIRITK